MGKFKVIVNPVAERHIKKHLKTGDKKTINNIAKILIELENTPFEGIGKPEALKYELTGFWSRRINQKDRIVYYLENNIVTVFVISAMGHYSDK
jgi:toxin YoeB